MDSSNTLLQVLNIINYTDDKTQFVDEFAKVCDQKALIKLTNSLPQEKLEGFEDQLSKTKNDPEQLKVVLNKYFSKDEYSEALKAAVTENFDTFIDQVAPTLSESQNLDLSNYLKSLQNTQSNNSPTNS